MTEQRIQLQSTLDKSVTNVSQHVSVCSGLPKARVKHAMTCGALQVKKGGGRKGSGRWQRLRRASSALPAGSQIRFFYDESLLALKPAQPTPIREAKDYSVWYKPAGLMSQGNQWGDHCSLLRQVELFYQQQPKRSRPVYLVHRLDRDACGLVMLAHSPVMAATLGHFFSGREIRKTYHAVVTGRMESESGCLDSPIEGKQAMTRFQCIERHEAFSKLKLEIETGRKHQIRVHLSQIGHPIVGDALYGVKNVAGLHLVATKLDYKCPEQGREVCVNLAESDVGPDWL